MKRDNHFSQPAKLSGKHIVPQHFGGKGAYYVYVFSLAAKGAVAAAFRPGLQHYGSPASISAVKDLYSVLPHRHQNNGIAHKYSS